MQALKRKGIILRPSTESQISHDSGDNYYRLHFSFARCVRQHWQINFNGYSSTGGYLISLFLGQKWEWKAGKEEGKPREEQKGVSACQVELPGFMQGVGAWRRPPSQRWLAEEVGENGDRRKRDRETRDRETHMVQCCIHADTTRISLAYTVCVDLETDTPRPIGNDAMSSLTQVACRSLQRSQTIIECFPATTTEAKNVEGLVKFWESQQPKGVTSVVASVLFLCNDPISQRGSLNFHLRFE